MAQVLRCGRFVPGHIQEVGVATAETEADSEGDQRIE